MQELIILVDEKNTVIGEMPKAEVHHKNTPLHRGFSAFLFNSNGELLFQQRSAKKVTWPLIWSNSCCGHPKLHEPLEQTVKHRITFELGISLPDITVVLPDYRYRYEHKGVVENEFCPVLVGFTDEKPQPNPDEVASFTYTPWESFLEEIKHSDAQYSEWCIEEATLLQQNELFQTLWRQHIKTER